MNSKLNDEDLFDLFAAQARAVPRDPVPTAAIMGHGRSLRRRRSAIAAVAAAIVVVATGYTARSMMRHDTGQLAVSGADTTTSDRPVTSSTRSSGGNVDRSSGGPAVRSAAADEEALTVADLTVGQRDTFTSEARPFRDGFFVPAQVATEDGQHIRSTVSLLFTTDGKQFRRLGPDLTVANDVGRVVVGTNGGDTSVSLVSVSVGSTAKIHRYHSTDFVDWTEDVVDVDFDEFDWGLSTAVRRVVTPVPEVVEIATNGDPTVITARMMFVPSQAVLDRYGIPRGRGILDERGLVESAPDGRGGELKASLQELGLTAVDARSLWDPQHTDRLWLLSVGQASPTEVTALEPMVDHEVFTAFGDSFVHVETPREDASFPPIGARIEVSADGADWTPLTPEIGPGETVVTVSPLDQALLVVTENSTEVRSYRVRRDLTTELLGRWPIPDGYTVTRGLGNSLLRVWPDDGGTTPLEDTDGGGIVFMPVGRYDVTVDLPTDENPTVRYVIVDRNSGETVVENSVDDPNFLEGETVDGERVIRFTDASGRPEIVIAADDLIGGSAPVDDMLIDLATTDGASWNEVPRPTYYSWPLAVNDNKVLIQFDDDNVIDQGEVHLEVAELG